MLDVDVVEAGTAQSNRLYAEFVQTVDDLTVDRIVDEHADRVGSRCKLDRIFVELGFVVFDFDARICGISVKGGFVVGLGIEKCELHVMYTPVLDFFH